MSNMTNIYEDEERKEKERDSAGLLSKIKQSLESIVERHRHEEILTCPENCWCWEVDVLCTKIDQKNDTATFAGKKKG